MAKKSKVDLSCLAALDKTIISKGIGFWILVEVLLTFQNSYRTPHVPARSVMEAHWYMHIRGHLSFVI